MRNQRGITLIALVITIIVLLILAGVSIAMLTGDNGILTKADESKYTTARAEAIEKINLALNAVKTEVYAQRVDEANWDPLVIEEEEVTGLQPEITTVLTNDGFTNVDGDNVYYYNLEGSTLTLSYYSVGKADLESTEKIEGSINLDATTSATFLDLDSASLSKIESNE